MNTIQLFSGFCAALALGACSTASTTPPASVPSVGSTTMDAGTGAYSVTVDGTTTDLGIRTATTVGGLIWDKPALVAYAFQDASVIATGGIIRATNTPFAGVTGTLGAAQTTGSATYTGRIGLVGVNPANGLLVDQNLILDLGVNFAAGTMAQNSGGVTIDGNISGSAFTGTVGWSGLTAPMSGGFYGTNTAAGAFSSAELAGAFLGTKP